MNNDLVKGYKSFLTALIRAQVSQNKILKAEIDYFTNGKLKDYVPFFICAFERVHLEFFENFELKDPNSLFDYLIKPKKENEIFKLTKEGLELKEYLQLKLEKQSNMLCFNGLKIQEVAKLATNLRRFDQFWLWILTMSHQCSN